METKKIVIVGNGNIGQAVLFLLKNKKYIIEIYDQDPARNTSGKTLEECLKNANFLFLCIPSWAAEESLSNISLYLNPKTILISISKGLNAVSKQSIDQVIEKKLKNKKYALLSGPMFAAEIKDNKMSFGIIASKDKKIFDEISKLFSDTKLKLQYCKNIHAVAISAVLKNIYTLFFGMINAYGEGNNTKGYLSSCAISEMIEIIKILKLDSKIILGVSGVGDFVATAASEYSQNRKVGEELFTSGNTSIKSEGLISLPSMIKLLGKKSKQLPLLSLLQKIIIDKKNPKTEIEKFLNK